MFVLAYFLELQFLELQNSLGTWKKNLVNENNNIYPSAPKKKTVTVFNWNLNNYSMGVFDSKRKSVSIIVLGRGAYGIWD